MKGVVLAAVGAGYQHVAAAFASGGSAARRGEDPDVASQDNRQTAQERNDRHGGKRMMQSEYLLRMRRRPAD